MSSRLVNKPNEEDTISEPSKAGEVVSVDFNNAQFTLCSKAEVIRRPCAEGDCWEFRDIKTGDHHCVSEGCTITRLAGETTGK